MSASPRQEARAALNPQMQGKGSAGIVGRRMRGIGWAILDLADAVRQVALAGLAIADALRERPRAPYNRGGRRR